MSTSTDTSGYHPPGATLFEAHWGAETHVVERTFVGWNGPATSPASDVTLHVRTGACRAVVSSGTWPHRDDARILAFLGANVLERVTPSASDLLNRSLEDSTWSRSTLEVDGVDLVVEECHLGVMRLAYRCASTGSFAAAGTGPFSIRTVTEAIARAYDVDPLITHSYAELRALGAPAR